MSTLSVLGLTVEFEIFSPNYVNSLPDAIAFIPQCRGQSRGTTRDSPTYVHCQV